ncbi:COG4705 family protein [Paenibacillus sp. VTT E-133280]|uniref:COG4705 family protein n=1 Tax=unclassified Paenibacillus TaxID=185978 RepID=UPI003592E861
MVKETSSLLSEDRNVWNKVPQVTVFFWIIKIMATTVGETAADFLNFNLFWGLSNTTLVMSGLLIAALYFQMSASKYVPALYWLAVVLISVVGTLITDNLVDNLGVSLEATTIVFSILLSLTFGVWYASERTLSIHSIITKKREMFYWLTILFTFALGTAAGDLVAESLNWGYLLSAIIFAALIGAITLAYYRFKLNAVTAFWLAYILTRPLGASLGDYLSQDRSEGGLELGTTGTSIIFIVIILGLVIYLTKTKKDEVAL